MVEYLLFGLLGVAALFMVLLFVQLVNALRRLRPLKTYTAATEAPSVSICIPARNEMHAMADCLERVLASDYEKMEVIVFDDSSADSTSILVKSFAHAGVRFIPGNTLPGGWLGKNYALESLAREANGSYIVFLDVDTFIKPTTISRLVSYALTERAAMVSVIPGRSDIGRASVLFGHLRYFWEVLCSSVRWPAASSSLWMIKRQTLLDTHGGFERMKTDVLPEVSLASMLGKEYRCLVTTRELGVTYEKKWHSQVETARRLLLPRVRLVRGGQVTAIAALFLLNVPIIVAISGFFAGWGVFQYAALILLLSGSVLYGIFVRRLWRKGWIIGSLLWPILIVQETVLFSLSAIGYANGTITWKGRPIMLQDRL